jgi:hypothetical protein
MKKLFGRRSKTPKPSQSDVSALAAAPPLPSATPSLLPLGVTPYSSPIMSTSPSQSPDSGLVRPRPTYATPTPPSSFSHAPSVQQAQAPAPYPTPPASGYGQQRAMSPQSGSLGHRAMSPPISAGLGMNGGAYGGSQPMAQPSAVTDVTADNEGKLSVG